MVIFNCTLISRGVLTLGACGAVTHQQIALWCNMLVTSEHCGIMYFIFNTKQ